MQLSTSFRVLVYFISESSNQTSAPALHRALYEISFRSSFHDIMPSISLLEELNFLFFSKLLCFDPYVISVARDGCESNDSVWQHRNPCYFFQKFKSLGFEI